MTLKSLFFYALCAASWLVLLPVLVVGGAATLLGYAVLAEVSDSIAGPTYRPLDRAAAREAARRMCLGH
jgi:hypothetical protein